MTVACILIVTQSRVELVRDVVLPSVLRGGFDEVLWVGDGEPGDGYEFLPLPRMTGTTVDALAKRDVGTLASSADWLCYLADDHAWASPADQLSCPAFAESDIIVPGRWCESAGQRIVLNMGLDRTDPNAPYCAGHGGFFRRSLIQARPWLTMPHHPNWDLLATRIQLEMGARLTADDRVSIQDLEPQHQPWR